MNTVEFPGLWGLKFTINRVAFEVFGVPIYWYGIIIAVGFLLAVVLAMRDSKRFGFESDNVIDLVLFAAPVAIIFARLYYVAFDWQNFKDNPMKIINIREGGLAIYGGVIGGILVAYIFARVKKLGILKFFDFAVPYLPLAQAIGRWGNFINQEAFGSNTTLPWGMTSEAVRSYLLNNLGVLRSQGMHVDPMLPVHPTFLYEFLWNIGVFLLLVLHRKRKKADGEVFFLYMILYGIGRFWIEGLRTDSLMLGSLRISQLLAGLFALGFCIIFYMRRRKVVKAESELDVATGESQYGRILKTMREESDEKGDGAESIVSQAVISGGKTEEDVAGGKNEDESSDRQVEQSENNEDIEQTKDKNGGVD